MIEPEAEQTPVEKEPTLVEMFKDGKRPHTRPWNKMKLNVKLKQNPGLAKEVIGVDKNP